MRNISLYHLLTNGSSTAAVLNSSPRVPLLCIFCMCLFVNIPDSDHQLIRSELRAWTVFRLTWSHIYMVSIAPFSLSTGNPLNFLHFGTFIHGFALCHSLQHLHTQTKHHMSPNIIIIHMTPQDINWWTGINLIFMFFITHTHTHTNISC